MPWFLVKNYQNTLKILHLILLFAEIIFFLAYLVTDIPVIYIGDTTFRLFNSQYMKINNCDFVNMADKLERLSLEKATHVVYSSNWAKNSAIKDYNIVPEKR